MKESKKGGTPDPGSEPKVFTAKEVREFVKRDCNAALLLLDAIYRDPNTLDAVADYLHGRYMNSKHKEELSKQQPLFNDKGNSVTER